jgi:transposase
MQSKDTTNCFEGQNIYVGIDAHLKNWKVTILLENTPFKTFAQDASAATLGDYLRRNFPNANYFSAYEAGFCGFSGHRELEKQGINNIVVNPADIPTTDKERKQKEDKRDSRKIANSLRNGELQGIYIPTIVGMEFRTLVRCRKTLVKEITRNKTRIKSLLYFNGIQIPRELDSASRHWSSRFTHWLNDINFHSTFGNKSLDVLLDTTLYFRQKLLEITRELRSISKSKPYSTQIQLLCSIPGIGLITALTLLSEIENILRFKDIDTLCSYTGLVPSTNSSSDKEIIRGITPRANKPLRGVIIEAAWMAVRNDPSLAIRFNDLCKRMKANKAIVRIAKNLLNRIRYVLKNETEYVCSIN